MSSPAIGCCSCDPETDPCGEKQLSPPSAAGPRRPPADVGGEEGLSESGCVMKMGCVCLTVRRGGEEEAGGRRARSASSEDMLETGMQEECSHSSVRVEAGVWLG